MRVLFSTNVPSPYRVDFFNELGKYCDLTVCFERKSASDRDDKWVGEAANNYRAIQLDLKPYKEDRSRGNALREFVRTNEFDIVIFTNYVSPATMSAISYCRAHRKKYYIEFDGGFNKKDSFLKKIIKKHLICGAAGYFTTCEEHKSYLLSLGIAENNIWKYPFSSVSEEDVNNAERLLSENKDKLKTELLIKEEKVILTVGRFIPCKRFDVLLKTVAKLDRKIGVYLIGGEPTEEYSNLCKELELENVHFVGFKTKQELFPYYAVADVFTMTTEGDVWGLVINEAMAYSLPIISSDRCIAALEMVKENENGYIVPVGNSDALAEKIDTIIGDDARKKAFSEKSLEIARKYTIEKMAERHIEIFEKILG